MKSVRGIKPKFVICGNENLNIFVARADDTDVIMRQPRKKDIGRSKLAMRDLSGYTWKRFRRANVDQKIYDPKYRSSLPLYRGEFPGILPLIIEVDDRIVGFSDMFFKLGKEFKPYNVGENDKCASGSIAILDRYQGMGLGTYYSYLSDEIARHFGCDFILGVAHLKGGTLNIRQNDGWEIIRKFGEYAHHRRRLTPEEMKE